MHKFEKFFLFAVDVSNSDCSTYHNEIRTAALTDIVQAPSSPQREKLLNQGFIEEKNGVIVLTPKGKKVVDDLLESNHLKFVNDFDLIMSTERRLREIMRRIKNSEKFLNKILKNKNIQNIIGILENIQSLFTIV